MGPKICEVCKDAQSKYKCPSCLVPYCSLVCFKKHKEIPCAKPEAPEEKPIAASSLPPERPCNVNEPSEVLQKVQLESIASSTDIQGALKNKELQKLICNIDCSPEALSELDKAMGIDAFRIFTDKILSAIRP